MECCLIDACFILLGVCVGVVDVDDVGVVVVVVVVDVVMLLLMMLLLFMTSIIFY